MAESGISTKDIGAAQEVQASILLTKDVLAEKLAKLELSLKTDIAAAQADLRQVLDRIEEAKERLDIHDQMLEEMREQVKTLQRAHRSLLYKMEDQENQSRSKNLRIKGLPVKYGDGDLPAVM